MKDLFFLAHPRVAAPVRTGPGQNQEPTVSFVSPIWVAGTHILGPSAALFPRELDWKWRSQYTNQHPCGVLLAQPVAYCSMPHGCPSQWRSEIILPYFFFYSLWSICSLWSSILLSICFYIQENGSRCCWRLFLFLAHWYYQFQQGVCVGGYAVLGSAETNTLCLLERKARMLGK